MALLDVGFWLTAATRRSSWSILRLNGRKSTISIFDWFCNSFILLVTNLCGVCWLIIFYSVTQSAIILNSTAKKKTRTGIRGKRKLTLQCWGISGVNVILFSRLILEYSYYDWVKLPFFAVFSTLAHSQKSHLSLPAIQLSNANHLPCNHSPNACMNLNSSCSNYHNPKDLAGCIYEFVIICERLTKSIFRC